MKMIDIRTRMLLAALLPVTLLAALLAAVFLVGRVGDVAEAHSQRARSLARQLASASEYGLFSANINNLQAIANGVLREADVRSATILDTQGIILVTAGQPGYAVLPPLTDGESAQFDQGARIDILAQPISASPVKLEGLFEDRASGRSDAPQLLGHVVLEVSREALVRREQELLLAGLAVTLGGLLFGGFLAVRIGRGVIQPILRISSMIERIGRGELSARGELLPDDPLRDLQQGLNQMAERLELGRDELEQRIALATAELREKKEEAETATLAKSRFLAAASHDLRQPTHALGMFVARLAQLPHDAETRQLVGSLDASVRVMQDLLNALLDISRLDAQAVPVKLRPFPVADIFEKLRSGLMPTALETGLRLRIRPTQVWVMSDPVLLQRILLNLVVNALRYTRRGGVLVACRVTGDGSLARIEVWDSGIGIAPEHHQEIFREFYQVGNPERDRTRGLGLGLNIVDRTARLMGHPLSLRSSLGCGTRFSIEMPLAPPGAEAAVPELAETKAFDDLAGLDVLVIEDDALAREGLVSLLQSWGGIVRVADGPSSAMQQLAHGPMPEVIISDYRLRAGANGIDTVSQLRALAGRNIPACLMSGDTNPGLIQLARDAELTLLHKPVRPAKLRSLIRRLANEEAASDRGGISPVQAERPDL